MKDGDAQRSRPTPHEVVDVRNEGALALNKNGLTSARRHFVGHWTLGVFLPLLLTACAPPRGSQIVVGAKNFTEQVVLGELVAQEIEAEAPGKKVGRRFYLAGSYLCHQALVSGRIDAYVEYSGTALTAILKQPLATNHDAAGVFRTIAGLYDGRFQVKVEPGLGFEDTFAMVVRGNAPAGLRKVSDLRGQPLQLGVGYEFQARPDGLDGLKKAYGLEFARPRVMDLGLLYRALSANQVDIIAGNSTDGPIRALGFRVLADDLHYFPPYEAVPLVREDSLKLHPEMQRAFARLAGKVNAGEMQAMNDAVDGKHEDVGEVVSRFRAAKGL